MNQAGESVVVGELSQPCRAVQEGINLSIQTTRSHKPEMRLPVSVKGTKDGLLFLLDEQCEFSLLIGHLDGLLNGETSAVFEGPEVAVSIDYGARSLTAEEQRQLMNLFLAKGNLIIREWSYHTSAKKSLVALREKTAPHLVYKGTVRAGQSLTFDGDIVIIGDVNPGAEVIAAGDVYVFGKLRGIAHAGSTGNEEAIIAAADFAPLQLRIGNRVSRAPVGAGQVFGTFMEFAYVREGVMAVDKLQFLSHWRQIPQLDR